MVEIHRLNSLNLSDYTHLLMTSGQYDTIRTSERKRIAAWVREGGILIATERAATWTEGLCFSTANDGCEEDDVITDDEAEIATAESIALDYRPYGQYEDDSARLVVGGAIVAARLDLTHPVTWGYQRVEMPLFRSDTLLLEPSDNAYSSPVRYSEEPLMSGYIGPQRQDEIRGQPAVIAERQGKGLVVRFANNPLFRGFWRGTERLWINALYMGNAVEQTRLPE
jgi:hypothetical protein